MMHIRFWGVRGSLPAPLLPLQIKEKFASLLEQVKPSDIQTPESRQRFLAALDPALFGTVGGNTPCVSLQGEDGEVVVFDGGSGLRELGAALGRTEPKPRHYHIFFSHFHGDHIQGLPFFGPAYDPSVIIDFYSPLENLEAALQGQMRGPYFPVGMDAMGAQKTFHQMTGKMTFEHFELSYKKMNHPGGSYSFLVHDGKRRFIYATDTELSQEDFVRNAENTAFFEGADLIVLDSQYTLGEAIEKYRWGHSSFSLAVDFAAAWGIRHLILFHHDPAYDDPLLHDNLRCARAYAERMGIRGIEISLAVEGMELTL